MTKEIKKKRGIDWVVFIIWALTALFLLFDAYGAYANLDGVLSRMGGITVSAHKSTIDSVSALIEENNIRTESESSYDRESASIKWEESKQYYGQMREKELMRMIVVALYVVTAGVFFVAFRGRSTPVTLLYIMLIGANVVLNMAHPWFLYR